MDNFKQYLEEARMAPLYHGTSLENIEEILNNNVLKISPKFKTLSFSRSKRYVQNIHHLLLELDQHKISQTYKIKPYNWYNDHDGGDHKPKHTRFTKAQKRNEYEEEIYKDLKPLNKYLVAIYFPGNVHDAIYGSGWLENVAYVVETYCKKYKIHLEYYNVNWY
jgi:hypothetical protein